MQACLSVNGGGERMTGRAGCPPIPTQGLLQGRGRGLTAMATAGDKVCYWVTSSQAATSYNARWGCIVSVSCLTLGLCLALGLCLCLTLGGSAMSLTLSSVARWVVGCLYLSLFLYCSCVICHQDVSDVKFLGFEHLSWCCFLGAICKDLNHCSSLATASRFLSPFCLGAGTCTVT